MDTSAPFHSIDIDNSLQKLQTSFEGLSWEEAKARLNTFGPNQIKEKKKSKIALFFRQFNNLLVYILIAASMISIFIKEWRDFFVIIGIILINAMIAFWQELKAQSSIEALKKMTAIKNRVIRGGKQESVESKELVPGDIVLFYEGEAITADCRLIDSHGLMVDEASLTGESVPVLKNHEQVYPQDSPLFDHENMLLAGTIVSRGSGKAVVARTAQSTYFSSIAEKAQEAPPDTPLTRALRVFVKGYVTFVIVLFSSLAVIGYFQDRPFLELIYILIAGLVSAVPEGLPIVLTLVMVIGAIKLSKKSTLVRYLPSVETMGSVSVIASDKTGTITQGKLIINEFYATDELMLKRIAALCNDSEGSGDPIDAALYTWVESAQKYREESPRSWVYSFDTKLRLMATKNLFEGKEKLFIKGAFESLKKYSPTIDPKFEEVLKAYLEKGYRVLTFGVGDWISEKPEEWKIDLIGLVGFIDPAKEGVKEAVEEALGAGVRTAMITGDHPLTAKEIAKQVSIYQENEQVLTGHEIESQPENQMLEAIKKSHVFARVTPEQKYRIVKMLQKNEEIVAVTGDGVNDVPALKAADIGIAMGSGTEAAKASADMIITDNNLRVIVDAIKNARVIADNMRKVIYYLMSTSLQELVLITLCILSNLAIPLSAIQILWINIVTDGVQDKFFAFAKEEGNVMQRNPRDPENLFFDSSQIIRILIFGLLLGGFVFWLYLHLLNEYSMGVISTVIFTSIVFAQWPNGIQAQKEHEPFFKNVKYSFQINPLVYLGLFLGVILQLLAVSFFPELFGSKAIPIELWKYPIFSLVASFTLVEVRKWIYLWFFNRKKRA